MSDAKANCGAELDKDQSLWIVGVIMSILASTFTNMGVNLQKYSFIQESKRKIAEKRSYIRQPLWAFGIFLIIFGSIGDFLALGFASQTLITPVGGFTMVANVGFAGMLLKEKFIKRDGIATGLIIFGVILVAMSADKETRCIDLQDLIVRYGKGAFITYVILVTIACCALYAASKYIEDIYYKFGPSSKPYKKVSKFHPVLYPALSGVFGAQSVLFAKSTMELIKVSWLEEFQFDRIEPFLIAAAMLTCIFLQIHWLAKGLQFFDAVFVVPVFQCFFISVSIIGGGVYFEEFDGMPTETLVNFCLGVFVTLAGVFLLSQRDMTKVTGKAKFRAGVAMVIFIKRVQKLTGHEYQWVDTTEMKYSSPSKTSGIPSAVVVPVPATIGSKTIDDALLAGSTSTLPLLNVNSTPQKN